MCAPADRDGADADFGVCIILQKFLRRRLGVSVAEDDDVFLCGVATSTAGEFLIRHLHRASEVRHVSDLHSIDSGFHSRLVGVQIERDFPVFAARRVGIGENAQIIFGADRVDALLGHLFSPEVTPGDFATMHDQHQRATRDDALMFDFKRYRHDLLDGTTDPAARTETVRPAQHDQPAAHVLDEYGEFFLLPIGERRGRHVGQNNARIVHHL